jgi:hypothetical protein
MQPKMPTHKMEYQQMRPRNEFVGHGKMNLTIVRGQKYPSDCFGPNMTAISEHAHAMLTSCDIIQNVILASFSCTVPLNLKFNVQFNPFISSKFNFCVMLSS